jgi:hypothetical protein
MSNKITCQICQKEITIIHQLSFSRHLQKCHNTKIKDYYDKFIKKENESKCLVCGKTTKFFDFNKGYNVYCSIKCNSKSQNRKQKSVKTCIKKYGSKSFLSSEIGQENFRNKMKDKYNIDNPSKSQYFLEKTKQTCIEKYGVEFVSQMKEVKESRRNKMVSNGYWKNESEISEFKRYSMNVWNETEKYKKELFDNWNGKCYYSNINLIYNKSDYNNPLYPVIDHVISIDFGFKNKIDYKIIGNIKNLVICSRLCNGQKWVNPVEEYLKRSLV